MVDRRFPHVTRTTTRHGKRRFRFRLNGVDRSWYAPWGSPEFVEAYEAAKQEAMNRTPGVRAAHGTFAWLIEQYRISGNFKRLSDVFRKNLNSEMEWLKLNAGPVYIVDMQARHIQTLMERKAGPDGKRVAAANKLRKLFTRLYRYAIRQGWAEVNPAQYADSLRSTSTGFHTWSEADIATFRAHWSSGSMPRLAMELALNTGAARQDLAAAAWVQVSPDMRFTYARGKTRVSSTVPILPELAAEMRLRKRETILIITHTDGRAYKPETLGNWFKACCVAAGLQNHNSHGLRKAGATRLAEAGASENEIAAVLGHKDTKQASTYTAAANKVRLAEAGVRRLGAVSSLSGDRDHPYSKTLKDKE